MKNIIVRTGTGLFVLVSLFLAFTGEAQGDEGTAIARWLPTGQPGLHSPNYIQVFSGNPF